MKQRPITKQAPTDPAALKISPAQVLPRLAALRTAPIADLKEQWRMLYGKEPPAFSRLIPVLRPAGSQRGIIMPQHISRAAVWASWWTHEHGLTFEAKR